MGDEARKATRGAEQTLRAMQEARRCANLVNNLDFSDAEAEVAVKEAWAAVEEGREHLHKVKGAALESSIYTDIVSVRSDCRKALNRAERHIDEAQRFASIAQTLIKERRRLAAEKAAEEAPAVVEYVAQEPAAADAIDRVNDEHYLAEAAAHDARAAGAVDANGQASLF